MSFKKRPSWVKKRRTIPGKLHRSRLVVMNEFQRQRALARKANAPEPDVSRFQYEIDMARLEAYKAGVPRPNYPFTAKDVADVHYFRDGDPGRWFELHNGKIFSGSGEPESRADHVYSKNSNFDRDAQDRTWQDGILQAATDAANDDDA